MSGRSCTPLLAGIVALVLGSTSVATASDQAGPVPAVAELHPYFAAPGNYGTAWGYASYGSPRGYTAFSSPYGAGYGYGYAPYVYGLNTFTVNWGGVSQVRRGFSIPGYAYGRPNYWTYPAPFTIVGPNAVGNQPLPPPPFGLYAPALGPQTFTNP